MAETGKPQTDNSVVNALIAYSVILPKEWIEKKEARLPRKSSWSYIVRKKTHFAQKKNASVTWDMGNILKTARLPQLGHYLEGSVAFFDYEKDSVRAFTKTYMTKMNN